MFSYMQVHLYYLFPPIAALLALYWPLLGRRDALKLFWVGLMATLYTTPWDNWILSQVGWTYPAGSIVGRIWLVPIEEHMFFILQPILVILLHSLATHSQLLPFDIARCKASSIVITLPERILEDGSIETNGRRPSRPLKKLPARTEARPALQTLPRRPGAAIFWSLCTAVGAALTAEAHGYGRHFPLELHFGRRSFYLGAILVWICPVIAGLTWLGARLNRRGWGALSMGCAWLWMVDTIAIRAGAWRISPETSFDVHVWRGLPFEEFLFFFLTTYLCILSASLISHLHTLLLLTPSLPPCPPAAPFAHISLLGRVVLNPPAIERSIIDGLLVAENTLREASKSFEVAKLAFGREMRIALIAVYGWCRVTDNLVDDPVPGRDEDTHASDKALYGAKTHTIACIRRHLSLSYEQHCPLAVLDHTLDAIHGLTPEARLAFHLFTALIPRLVPPEPFLELCEGYITDLCFVHARSGERAPEGNNTPARRKLRRMGSDAAKRLPITTTDHLLRYADDVAGSIAAAICYLAWSTLTTSTTPDPTRPVEALQWSHAIHQRQAAPTPSSPDPVIRDRIWVTLKAREMGRALQLVNIARDIAKDSTIGRLYIPLSSFPSAAALLDVLFPSRSHPPSYAPYSLPLLDMADNLRQSSEPAMSHLPRTARGGTRAMVASYFEIATAVRNRNGEVDERGVKVEKWRRLVAAAGAMWIGSDRPAVDRNSIGKGDGSAYRHIVNVEHQ